MHSYSFRVAGRPVAKGSKRGFVKGGRVVMVEAARNLTAWQNAVRFVLQDWPHGLLTGPVALAVIFYFPRPKSRKKQIFITTRPDLDKLARAIGDAMTGIVVRDDAQIAIMAQAKVYDEEFAGIEGIIGWDGLDFASVLEALGHRWQIASIGTRSGVRQP